MQNIIIIDNISQIEKPNVRYAHRSNASKWIMIEYSYCNKDFCVSKLINGKMPTIIGSETKVKYWKTFNGVRRALKTYSKDGRWGMSHWNNDNNL